MTEEKKPICCSFCDAHQDQVKKLIAAGAGDRPIYICEGCVAISLEILISDGYQITMGNRMAREGNSYVHVRLEQVKGPVAVDARYKEKT